MHIVGGTHHKNDVDVGSFDDIVTDSDGMKHLCSSQTALHKRFAQRIGNSSCYAGKNAKTRKDIKALIKELSSNELSVTVETHYRLWEGIERELAFINKRLAEQARDCSLDALYQRIPGIGRVSARILANELGDL